MVWLLLLLFCACIVLIFLNGWYKHTNHYKNSISDVLKYKKPLADNIKIAVIGSNHAKYAFDFVSTPINGVNLAIGPEAFEYDYIILKKYVSHLAPGAVVIIPICLFSFFLYRFDNIETYLKYYLFLDRSEFPHYTFRGKLESKYPILFNPKLIRYIIKDISPIDRMSIDYNPLKTDNSLDDDANKWVEGWKKQFGISTKDTVLSNKNNEDILKNISILSDILSFCNDMSLKPIIVILPITHHLFSKFDTVFLERFIFDLIKQSNNCSAPVLNYLQDERYMSPSLYVNSFFLNIKGRVLFTRGFVEDLKKQGYYDSNNK